jgi:hypothetical protein
MLHYDLAHQRWRNLPPEKVLEEAATLFNMAVFLVSTQLRRNQRDE